MIFLYHCTYLHVLIYVPSVLWWCWLGGRKGIQTVKKYGVGWWRQLLVSLDGVAPSRMISVSTPVNLPLHHEVQKFSSGTGSPGLSRKKGHKAVVVCAYLHEFLPYCYCQQSAQQSKDTEIPRRHRCKWQTEVCSVYVSTTATYWWVLASYTDTTGWHRMPLAAESDKVPNTWQGYIKCGGICTTTTTILQPLYRTSCVSQHLQLRTAGFCWSKGSVADCRTSRGRKPRRNWVTEVHRENCR